MQNSPFNDMNLEQIEAKLNANKAIDREEAFWLLTEADLLQVGTLADGIRKQKHPEGRVTFVVDRNVNYSNVCETKCKFCAFHRNADDSDAYLLTNEEIFSKVQELVDHNGTQLLMQGGTHPTLTIDWYEDLFRELRKRFPQVQIHSLSPAEVIHVAKLSGISMEACLKRLQDSGLASVPGGGAEILVDSVRKRISPNKIGWRQWASVMEEAHRIGMRTTATMMFGSEERQRDIVEHLFRIREIQENSGGFTAFIPWSYQPDNTELGGETASGVEYLKILALSRIVLNNIDNIQGSWVTQGERIAQIALFFGANDLGGTLLEENVVAAAGCSFRISQDDLVELIRGAGFIPAQRTTEYTILKEY